MALVFVDTITSIQITFDTTKRQKALLERGLDFLNAVIVFQGITVEVEDTRKEYASSESSVSISWLSEFSLLDTHRVVRIATYSE